MKAKEKKTVFVAFCNNCGFSRPIRDYVMKHYIANPAVKDIACLNNTCSQMTLIPEYLKKLAKAGDLK